MTDNRIRIICVVVEGDADTVIDKLAEVIQNAVSRAPELPKPEAPMSRPENFPAHLRPLRRRQ